MPHRTPRPRQGRLARPDGTHIAYEDHAPQGHPPGPRTPGSRSSDSRTAEARRPRSPQSPHPSAPRKSVLLLHGLAGHRGEWDDLAGRLRADGHRVVAYDARGHGDSTRRPGDVSRQAYVGDAAALIEDRALAPAVLVGQSFGGHTALLLAAARPDLVKSLILVEAGPAMAPADLPGRIAAWLDSWPVPFPTAGAAARFFGHEVWARSLEERADGWWPKADRDVMVSSITELARRDHWREWEAVTCPVLVVRGADGTMREAEFTEMHARRPHGTTPLTVPGAGHDVHLDQPEALYEAVSAFLT
ncbi:alpha/beta fold hydrolase [Streptomyces sp. NRRL S-340]|uniref:alpha/beta fold hydrolase n=1 Tax=Streptomyces sp. NRRL S-340 TaxID=1463901 RepID=UPI000AE3DA39|nr:alpha/beta hydrolase [Streptomyces sp. NRRL S-340]